MDLITPNDYADFWRNEVGVNVIPADAIIKKTWVKWTKHPDVNMQTEPIPLEMHDEWKKNGDFKNGMAIICGKIHHRKDKSHLYLAALDADNGMGIDCMTADINELAKHTLVEQHANPEKAHIYVYTTTPMQKKSSDSLNAELDEKMKANEIPAIELKGEGGHGIMYCTPSPHKDGSNYHIIGTKELMIMDGIGQVVSDICKKYNLGVGSNGVIPMKTLMDPETKILEGHNRHVVVMQYAESILRRYPKMTTDEFDGLVMLWNNAHCKPPLIDSEVEKQKICAIRFINEKIDDEKKIMEGEKLQFGTDSFWTNLVEWSKKNPRKERFIKCLECKVMVDDNPLDKTHNMHRVTLI